jgi:hypothetical protein
LGIKKLGDDAESTNNRILEELLREWTNIFGQSVAELVMFFFFFVIFVVAD